MEVVNIVHVPKKAKLVEAVELKTKDEVKKATEIEKEIYEFRKRAPKPRRWDCNWLTYMDKVPKWMWLTGLGLLIYAAMAFFISTMIVYFYSVQSTIRPIFSTNTAPGGSCSSTSQCVTNAYCVKSSGSNTGSCQCATNYYYDSTVSTSQCNARLAFGSTCTTSTQCITSAGLTCISGTCGCNSNTYFYNTTSLRCQYLKLVNQACSATSECSNTNQVACSSSRCQCRVMNNNFYFNPLTGSCVYRTTQTGACSTASTCMFWAYCGQNTGDTYSKCYCDPLLYYYDNVNLYCRVRQSTYQSSCTIIDQCDLYTNNLRCFNGLCDCDPTFEKWNSNYTQCLNLYRYSKTCLNNAPYYGCITSPSYSLTCAAPDNGGIRNICRCTSTQYYDVLTPGCLTQKTYNTTCGTRSECSQYSFCSTYGSSSVTKRCICLPNYSYNVGTTCLAKKGYGQSCGNTYECQDYAGMVCSGGTCGCDSTIQFYNTSSGACQWLARSNDFCVSSTQCKSGTCYWTIWWAPYTYPYCS